MKLYISAITNNSLESAIRYSCKYVLYSYYTLSKIRNKETLLSLLKLGNIFLDSGAHTLQKPGNNVDWDKYVENYIEFIKKYKRYISVIVELDIENKVGLKK